VDNFDRAVEISFVSVGNRVDNSLEPVSSPFSRRREKVARSAG